MPSILTCQADYDALLANGPSARVRVVEAFTGAWGAYLGVSRTPGRDTQAVLQGTGASTWIHEIGHGLGLNHRPITEPAAAADVDNIMRPYLAGNGNTINESERYGYRQ